MLPCARRIGFSLVCAWSLGLVLSGATQVKAQEAGATKVLPPISSKPLFDGKTLEGWDGDPRLWQVRDGVIRGETSPENAAKGNTFLICKAGEFRDFELQLEFRCNADNNSGIQYRSRHIQDGSESNPWVVRGYQHELRNEEKFPDVCGFIYDEGGKRGRLCLVGERASWDASGKHVTGDALITQDEFRKQFRLNDWNHVRIVVIGNRIRHFLNGKLILDFEDNDSERKLERGVIALQLHAGKPMWAEFREIRIQAF